MSHKPTGIGIVARYLVAALDPERVTLLDSLGGDRPGSLPIPATLLALTLLGPVALQKLNDYACLMSFFSHYAVRREALLLEGAMAFAVVRICLQRGLGRRQLWACPRTRVLGLFALLYLLLQASVWW
jgi:hypothetical protein